MAIHNAIESSYRSLETLGVTVNALVELAEILPSENRYSSIVRVLAERLESDMEQVRKHSYEVWHVVPEVPDTDDNHSELHVVEDVAI